VFGGAGVQAGVVLQAEEAHGAVEREGDLLVVEQLKDDDLAFGQAEAAQALQKLAGVVEQVADDDDDAAGGEAGGVVFEAGAEIAGARGLKVGEARAEVVDLAEAVGALEGVAGAVVEEGGGDGVALLQDEVGEAGGEAARVVHLGDLAGAEVHRGGAVEEEVGDEVGVLLVLLDVILVGAAEDLPVEVAGVVAGGVFAVLGELDGEAVEGGAVFA